MMSLSASGACVYVTLEAVMSPSSLFRSSLGVEIMIKGGDKVNLYHLIGVIRMIRGLIK